MKKLIIFIIPLMIGIGLIGCDNMDTQDSSNADIKKEEINFVERDYYEIDFDDIEFPVDLSDIVLPETPIHTKEDAIKVGQMIIDERHRNGKSIDEELGSIVHSKQDNMWRFEYGPHELVSTTSDNITVINFYDDALYVAVDGDTGKLIKAWVG